MAAPLIRQFDVFGNPGHSRRNYPLVVVLQSDLVDATPSVIVAPLVDEGAVLRSKLTPSLQLKGHRYVLLTLDLASIPRARLRDGEGSVMAERHLVIAALDILFTGF